MGRSEQKQVQQQGNTLLGNENATTAETKNLLMPALSSELQNPGYTDAQKTAITGATEGGIGAAGEDLPRLPVQPSIGLRLHAALQAPGRPRSRVAARAGDARLRHLRVRKHGQSADADGNDPGGAG